ncbi:MAG: ferric reductase-like transmembrane domain-containing protein [Actinobacteria bacterium]|nr:ferric reductase-like transmembrane domain-containing protein [Actinomycetota bacterium]MBI3688860.1 ferric reductase-like transmembrane domain-containing protein [Actinomycetota bacterium]
MVSLLLLSTTMVLGALTGGRFAHASWPRFTVSGLHRSMSLVGLGFVGAHVATAVIDSYAGIGWLDVLVPFTSVYRPLWLGLGAIAFDLVVALVATSLMRPRIDPRGWRIVHWAAYACWPLAVAHGLGAGPADARLTWVLAVNAGCVLAVVVAVTWRATASHPDTVARGGGGW